MPSSVSHKRIRRSPAARRAEIVAAASTVALREGLECITLRRIADDLGVRPGLISHYFPAVEDLVAEAYGDAAGSELDSLLPADRAGATPTQHLARFFARATGETYDDISRLWLNARHLSRYRPLLRDRVVAQENAWRGRLEGVIREGVAQGEFRTEDALVTAVQILVVIDGLGAHANTATEERPPELARMAVLTAERGLGLPSGALTYATAPN
ncbi:TetR/AcrR family transcriptional regulator [Streptomyces sp. NPDC088746]|uniref:TetR/AcrR family transcriptional regulator n=1 Tax=Streptomyces sp. NPDC088746 TaxID=3365885 RepID=UPI0037F93E3C